MKSFYLLLFVLWSINLTAQTITGRVIDEYGAGLQNYQVIAFVQTNDFSASTDSAGYFFINLSKHHTLPEDYVISNNYPNPFNPITRIDVSLPLDSKIKVEIFNAIGQNVGNNIEKEMRAGTNFLDLELNGLPNGVYFARINVNNKFYVVRKMILLYGSGHLSIPSLGETNFNSKVFSINSIDSLVVNFGFVRSKTFINLPELTEDGLNLGNLEIQTSCPDLPTVFYSGKTYHTVQIGTQCWLRENLDVGKFVLTSTVPENDNILDKFCFNDDTLNCNKYGGLYRWHEAMKYTGIKEGNQGICPEGWHIPKLDEFKELKRNLWGVAYLLVDEGYPNATNASGFSAMLGGIVKNGVSLSNGEKTDFWMSTNKSSQIFKNNNNYFFDEFLAETKDGFSVRCVKGSLPPVPELLFPPNGYRLVPQNTTYKWKRNSEQLTYEIQTSIDERFIYLQNEIIIEDTEADSAAVTLVCPIKYFLRMRAKNYLGYSDWSEIYEFETICKNVGVPCPGAATVVHSGRIYHTVQIGNTCWLKENLDVGEMVPNTQQQTNNLIIEKYCYNNMPANCNKYGGLYKWHEAMQYKSSSSQGTQGICPNGWQIASSAVLEDFTYMLNGNTQIMLESGTNETGFSAKLGGYYDGGNFTGMGSNARIWSGLSFVPGSSLVIFYLRIDNTVSYKNSDEWSAYSVRCTKPAP
ncbi:MAG: FISUMP domain-containing protein [bacterium]